VSSANISVLSTMASSKNCTKNRWAELEREQRKSPKVCFLRDSDSVYRPESVGIDSLGRFLDRFSFRLDAARDDFTFVIAGLDQVKPGHDER